MTINIIIYMKLAQYNVYYSVSTVDTDDLVL